MSISLGAGPLAVIGLGLPLLALLLYRRVPAIAVWVRAVLAARQRAERPADMERAAAYQSPSAAR